MVDIFCLNEKNSFGGPLVRMWKYWKKWMDLVVTEVKIPYVYTYMYLNTYHGLNF